MAQTEERTTGEAKAARTFDVRVRRGRARLHRMGLALDNLKAAGGPVTLRVAVQANLPRRSKGRAALEYQRITSYLVDCRTPEAVQHVRKKIAELMREFDRATVGSGEEPPATQRMSM